MAKIFSGERSKPFWDAVEQAEQTNGTNGTGVLYDFGCKAQEMEDAIKQLREERLQELHKFLEDRYPEVDGPGWLRCDSQRRTILDFLKNFEAEKAKGE